MLFLSKNSHTQQKTISLNRFYAQEIERAVLADSNNLVHTGSKPFLESAFNQNEVYGLRHDTLKVYSKAMGILLKHHLFSIKKDDFFLALDPLFEFTAGEDFGDTTSYAGRKLFTNQRGLTLIGDIGKKFSFQTSFYETQTFVPLYYKRMVDKSGVFPGFGRTKVYNLNGYDFAMANGWISYTPAESVNIQFGNGKNFIGHGYRSLLLSDAAFSYPFVKAVINSPNKKIQYTAMYASLQTLDRLPRGEVPESLFKRKGGSFNYLSWKPNSSIELGLFEGIIWERYDSTGTKPQPYGAYIPVIGVNTALNGFGNQNHVLIGMTAKIKTTKHSFLYGQVAADRGLSEGLNYQVGFSYFDCLIPNLDIQVEWNNLASKTYSSHFSLQSYSHTNQPLGHPTGPATQELLAMVNYRYARFMAQVKLNHINHSTGAEGDWSSDPDAIIMTIAPMPVLIINQIDCTAGFQINPKTNFQILLGYTNRNDRIDNNFMEDSVMKTSYVYLSLRTNLINRYQDF
jgi:hypothetical protein